MSTPQQPLPTKPAPPQANLDLNNIQGDILYVSTVRYCFWTPNSLFYFRSGLPKKTETYVFFQISEPKKFKTDLRKFIPLVKTVAGALKDRDDISKHKKGTIGGKPTLIPMFGVNISFSHFGLKKVCTFVSFKR